MSSPASAFRLAFLALPLALAIGGCDLLSGKPLEKGQVITTADEDNLDKDAANDGKRFAVVGYPFIKRDIRVGPDGAANISIYTEPMGKGDSITMLPFKAGTGKNQFDIPATFTMDDLKIFDNDGKPHKATDKLMFSPRS